MAQSDDLIAFAEVVRKMSHQIAVKCLAGKTNDAGEYALELCRLAADVKAKVQMQQEVKSGYDLGTLTVDPATPTDSETSERWHS